MSKLRFIVIALLLALPLACAEKAGDTQQGITEKAKEAQINFLIEQDRWGEIAPCG